MPTSTAAANGVSASTVGMKPARRASDRRCRGRRGTRSACSRRTRRSPRTRTRAPGRRAGRSPIVCRCSTTSTTKRLDAEAEVVEGERVGRRGDQPDARRHLRRERADERDDEQPRDDGGHDVNAETASTQSSNASAQRARRVTVVTTFSASISAGTISNRSPTMP